MVPDEDRWLPQCQRQELHHQLEGWSRIQRNHTQTQVRIFKLFTLQLNPLLPSSCNFKDNLLSTCD